MLADTASGSPLRTIRRSERATIRLFCFPPAGAGPSIFNDWAKLLPSFVELVGVVYPGRECRSAEPLSRDLGAIADSVAEHISSSDDLPCAFFGHSMGGYVCFEVMQRLTGFTAYPDHMFLSAVPGPHMPVPEKLHELPDAQFFRELVRLDGFPQEVLNTPELVRYALPILRADFTACETHRFRLDTFCRCPLSVYGGSSDIRVTRDRLEGWRHFAGLSFSLRIFEGGHFYLRRMQAELVSIIGNELAKIN